MTTKPLLALLGLAALLAGGCTTAALQDAAPQPVAAVEGGYPNLNVSPQPATSQLAAEETAAEIAALKAAKARQGGAGGGGAETARLKALARKHGDETLRQIEE